MESANMNRFKLRTMAAGLSLVLLLSACTANDGVATSASESVPASTDASSSDPNAVSLADKTLDDIYGSQLGNYLNHQYYFEGEPVSMTESNFYFVDTFTELTQYAGYYYPATAEGFIDLSATIDTTGMSEEMTQYNTYGDFFVAYSEQMLESSLIINKLAAEKGLELPAETLTQIDEIIANLQTTYADPAGISLDQYLSIYYGEGVTAESFRQTIVNYYMADLYTQDFIDNYEFDESEITVPNVRYTLYQVPQGATEEQITAAEESANALFDEAAGDLDTFTVEAALAYTNGETADYGDIAVPNDGSLDETFTNWAWDASRQEGDIDVIYSSNFGYFVLAYLGTTEVSQSTKDQIAVEAMSRIISDAINNEEYDFYVADEYAPAPTVAPATDAALAELGLTTETTGVDAGTGSAVGSLTGNKAIDILLISLSVVGGVAIIGLAAIGVMHLSKKKEGDSSIKEKKEAESDGDNE